MSDQQQAEIGKEQEMKAYNPKDKVGKPEGARYAFLDGLSLLYSSSTIQAIGYAITSMAFLNEKNDYESMWPQLQLILNVISQCGDNESIYIDYVKLRMDAVNRGKYLTDGYRIKLNLSEYLDAMARHLLKFLLIDERDEESGCLHLAHILANVAIMSYQLNEHYIEGV